MEKGKDYIGIAICFYCHDGQGNFVLNKRNQNCRDEHGRWDFGGGGLKFGETFQECLAREVKEEYGTEIVKCEFIGFDEVFRNQDGVETHWVDIRYKVQLDRNKVINAEPHKHDEIGWFTLDNLPSPLHSQLPHELIRYRSILETIG